MAEPKSNVDRTEALRLTLAHDNTCSICLMEMHINQPLLVHDCKRAFHLGCMVKVVQCPICRIDCRPAWAWSPRGMWTYRTTAAFNRALAKRVGHLRQAAKRISDEINHCLWMLPGGIQYVNQLEAEPGVPSVSARPGDGYPSAPMPQSQSLRVPDPCACRARADTISRVTFMNVMLTFLMMCLTPNQFASDEERYLRNWMVVSRLAELVVILIVSWLHVDFLARMFYGALGIAWGYLTFHTAMLAYTRLITDPVHCVLYLLVQSLQEFAIYDVFSIAMCQRRCVLVDLPWLA